jgi:hypothetical protein
MNPLRDDHVASLARADALDVELDHTRKELVDARARIEELEQLAPAPAATRGRVLPWLALYAFALALIGAIGWLAVREPPVAEASPPRIDAPAPDAYRVPIDDPSFELSCPLDEPYVPE